MFPQPPFPLKREPTASAPRGDNANAIDFVTIASSLRATSSTRIDCYRSLFMSLVRGRKNQTRPLTCTLRQARRSLSRRRCGSHFEAAHSVNKYALNGCPFGCGCPTHNCNGVAISLAQGANITVATGNNITHTLRAYHLHCLAARVPSANKHIPLISTP